MPRTRFNSRLGEEIGRDPGLKQALAPAARDALAGAKRFAPHGKTGDYEGSLQAVWINGRWVLLTTDFAGSLVEFGSINNPAYAPLRRGVRSAGLRVEEHSR